jgi:hypothetical protein
MGAMRFVTPPHHAIPPEAIKQVCFAGLDRVGWPAAASLANGELVLERDASDSGSMWMPWEVQGHGQPILSTACLIEQNKPYRLPLELARGTVSQLRNQLADWQLIGLAVSEPIQAKVSEAVRQFAHAVVHQDDAEASSRSAQDAILSALDASTMLTGTYVEQSMAVRRRTGRLLSFLACDLGRSRMADAMAKQVLQTFTAGIVPIRWRDIEATEGAHSWDLCDKQLAWCKAQGLKIFSGPLLNLDVQAVPTWLYLWEDDFENLQSFVVEFVTAVVNRYKGKVNFWQAAARVNGTSVLSLSEEECLQLTALVVEQIRTLDPERPVLMSINQPWAEYMRGRAVDFPPLHFADTLIRSGLEIAGIVLEVNLGYTPGGTLPRTLMEFNRQLDTWALLGLPLFVSLTAPSAHADDALAQRQVEYLPSNPTPQSQQALVARLVPLILSKSFVRGVIWTQLSDHEPHEFPHGGLFDAKGQPKPAFKTFGLIREKYLK